MKSLESGGPFRDIGICSPIALHALKLVVQQPVGQLKARPVGQRALPLERADLRGALGQQGPDPFASGTVVRGFGAPIRSNSGAATNMAAAPAKPCPR